MDKAELQKQLQKLGIPVKAGMIKKSDIKKILAESEAVGTEVEDALDDVRNAIHELKMGWLKISRKVKEEDINKWRKIGGVVNELVEVDDKIANLL